MLKCTRRCVNAVYPSSLLKEKLCGDAASGARFVLFGGT